jgi:PAS domain-containing protein
MKSNGSLSEATVVPAPISSLKRSRQPYLTQHSSHIAFPAANHRSEHSENVVDLAGTSYGKMELVLNELGMICDWNSQFRDWLGYRRSDLVFRHISILLPKLAEMKLMCGRQINPRLRFLFRIGYQFQLVGFAGKQFEGRLFINNMENRGRHYLRTMIFPVKEWISPQYIIDI